MIPAGGTAPATRRTARIEERPSPPARVRCRPCGRPTDRRPPSSTAAARPARPPPTSPLESPPGRASRSSANTPSRDRRPRSSPSRTSSPHPRARVKALERQQDPTALARTPGDVTDVVIALARRDQQRDRGVVARTLAQPVVRPVQADEHAVEPQAADRVGGHALVVGERDARQARPAPPARVRAIAVAGSAASATASNTATRPFGRRRLSMTAENHSRAVARAQRFRLAGRRRSAGQVDQVLDLADARDLRVAAPMLSMSSCRSRTPRRNTNPSLR